MLARVRSWSLRREESRLDFAKVNKDKTEYNRSQDLAVRGDNGRNYLAEVPGDNSLRP